MTDKLRPIFYGFAIFSVLWVWGNCRESAGASKQRLRDSTVAVNAHSHQTDLRVSRLAAESLELGARLMRLQRNDSVARTQISRLKSQLLRGGRLTEPQSANLSDAEQPVGKTAGEAEPAPPVDLLSQLAIRDTIIAQQDSVIAAQSEQVTIWKALAVERGEIIPRLIVERDSYKAISAAWQGKAGKRLGCAGGPTVVASLSGRVSAGVGVTCGIRF